MSSNSDTMQKVDLPWQKLITEQHVRAARLRSIQYFFLIMSILSILTVVYFGKLTPGEAGYVKRTDIASLKKEEWEAQATSVVSNLQVESMTFRELQYVPGKHELSSIIPLIIQALNANDGFPSNLRTKYLSHQDFWRSPWEPSTLVYTKKGKVRVVGAFVRDAQALYNPDRNPLKRWLGVFRKTSVGWQAYSVQFDGSVIPEGATQIEPKSLPLALVAVSSFN